MKLAVGIDIGGTNIVFGFLDQKGNILYEESLKTKYFCTPDTLVDTLSKKIQAQLDENKDWELVGIGIGAPNGNYFKGTIEHAPNLDWKGIVPLVDLFKKYFDQPIILTNDANAAAIGEMLFGVAKNESDFILVTLGTGLGSGFVSGGQLIYGHDGFAGELGHTIVEVNGRKCGCGRRGCLETYASATGLVRTAQEWIPEDPYSILNRYNSTEISSRVVAEAANEGDQLAQNIFEFTAEKLALGLANAVAITSPSMIVLYGGVSQAGDLLMTPLKKHFENYLQNIFQNKIRLEFSGLEEGNVAVLGAGALVWKSLN
ncbi:MAG: ROK family protein [Crocinitomicaceae bacterium]|nr:ROK family protein [Crocinitomicaceae bacterium]